MKIIIPKVQDVDACTIHVWNIYYRCRVHRYIRSNQGEILFFPINFSIHYIRSSCAQHHGIATHQSDRDSAEKLTSGSPVITAFLPRKSHWFSTHCHYWHSTDFQKGLLGSPIPSQPTDLCDPQVVTAANSTEP